MILWKSRERCVNAMLAIGCDHAAYGLKRSLMKFLDEEGFAYVDCGCDGEPCDYPIIAETVCRKIVEEEAEFGILLCGTGIGMSIAANKIKGIRAACCSDSFSVRYTRLHNNTNVLCMGARTLGEGLARELLSIFLHTSFEGGRHQRRIAMITALEQR